MQRTSESETSINIQQRAIGNALLHAFWVQGNSLGRSQRYGLQKVATNTYTRLVTGK